MCGFDVVVIKCEPNGNLDLVDLKAKIKAHPNDIAAFMITYPSTYGVFEPHVKEICGLIHEAGGQVYSKLPILP